MLHAPILYVTGVTYIDSEQQIFWETFPWQFFILLSEFLPEICWEEVAKEIFFVFHFWCPTRDRLETSEKILLERNMNAKLLRLVGATFDTNVASVRRMRKKNLIILESLQKNILPFFVLFVCRCWHWAVKSQLKCWGNYNMFTECTYDSVVFKIFLNMITICIFIEQ